MGDITKKIRVKVLYFTTSLLVPSIKEFTISSTAGAKIVCKLMYRAIGFFYIYHILYLKDNKGAFFKNILNSNSLDNIIYTNILVGNNGPYNILKETEIIIKNLFLGFEEQIDPFKSILTPALVNASQNYVYLSNNLDENFLILDTTIFISEYGEDFDLTTKSNLVITAIVNFDGQIFQVYDMYNFGALIDLYFVSTFSRCFINDSKEIVLTKVIVLLDIINTITPSKNFKLRENFSTIFTFLDGYRSLASKIGISVVSPKDDEIITLGFQNAFAKIEGQDEYLLTINCIVRRDKKL